MISLNEKSTIFSKVAALNNKTEAMEKLKVCGSVTHLLLGVVWLGLEYRQIAGIIRSLSTEEARCKSKTLAHIIGQSIYTKARRIVRHK